MHRSIVIPKGTIIPDKTTIVRIPITIPTNTTPLIVVNRQSSIYKPSDTQEYQDTSLPRAPAAPMNLPEMYQPQGRTQLPSNQTFSGQNGYNINQTRRSSNSNTRNSNSIPNNSNLVAYCTDKYPEPDNNVVECECVVDSEPNDTFDSDEPPCFCDAYSLCKSNANESSPYIPCPSNTLQQSSSTRYSPNSTSRGPQMNSTFNNESNVKRSSKYESRNATYWPSNNESYGQDTSQYINCPSNSFQGNNSSFAQGPSETFNRSPANGSLCECNNDAEDYYPDDEDDSSNCLCSPQAPCKDYDTQYSPQANSTFESSDDGEVDCFCSPESACKYSENQYNDFLSSTQADSAFGYPDSTFNSDNGGLNCLCTPQAPCKVANDQYDYSPQANSTFATPQRQPPNSTFAGRSAGPSNDSFRQICECNPNNNAGIEQNSQYGQYVASSSTRGPPNTTFRDGGGCPDYSPCPLSSQAEQQNTIMCPTYLDSINEEDEDAGDNQPNPNMRIIHVSSRTYSRIDDGPVQGKSFTFDDPEMQGVSSKVFDQLAKSILEDPPEDDQQDTFRTCTDKPEFLYSNFDGQQQDKQCKC